MADQKIYVPRQHTKRGVAGYRGANVVVTDGKTETPAEVVVMSAAPIKVNKKVR